MLNASFFGPFFGPFFNVIESPPSGASGLVAKVEKCNYAICGTLLRLPGASKTKRKTILGLSWSPTAPLNISVCNFKETNANAAARMLGVKCVQR